MTFKRTCFAVATLLTVAMTAHGADSSDKTNAPPAKKEEPRVLAVVPDATTKPVVQTNTLTIGGESVTYTVEAGMLPLLKADATSRASVFYTAYTRQGLTNAAARPLMICFNGGPGS